MKDQNTIDVQQIELSVKDGKPMVTSLQIAEHFGKDHYNVVRDVRNALDDDDPAFNALNFEAVTYQDEKGESRPMYLLSRDAFIFVVMGYTGKEARRIKKAYTPRWTPLAEPWPTCGWNMSGFRKGIVTGKRPVDFAAGGASAQLPRQSLADALQQLYVVRYTTDA